MSLRFCKACQKDAPKRQFPQHLRKHHSETQESYTLKYLYNNEPTFCGCGCGKATKYVPKQYRFNKYIHNHHKPTLNKPMAPGTKKKISERQKLHQDSLSPPQRRANIKKAQGACRASSIRRYGVENVFALQRKTEAEIHSQCKSKSLKFVSSYGDYANKRSKLRFQCLKCNCLFKTRLEYIFRNKDVRQCPRCKKGASMAEKEVVDFIRSVYDGEVLENVRNVIPPKELDIYIPERKLGIEYCGLYWHSSKSPTFKRSAHRDKAKEAHASGLDFFLFFEDEWKNKKDLIKQMIKYRLGIVDKKIYARKCKVVKYEKASELRWFFDRNHIDGSTRASYAYALEHEGVPVMALSVRTNFRGETEIARLASDVSCVVPGGASKLLKSLPRPIISFSNNRLSKGDIYIESGFEEITQTKACSYWYTDLNERVWRFRCRRRNPGKDKITQEEFDRFPTETKQAEGGIFSREIFGDYRPLFRVEDCGHRKWILR